MNYLCYDLETTGLNCRECEIVQFSALLLNEKLEVVSTFNVFHATEVSDYILNLHGKTQEFYYVHGLSKKNFIKTIEDIVNNNKVDTLIGHNSIRFDNTWLSWHTELDTRNYSQVDTLVNENRILGCDKYGNLPNGRKVSRTLKSSCERHGIEFDEEAAHDGLYDCTKTLELYKKQLEVK